MKKLIYKMFFVTNEDDSVKDKKYTLYVMFFGVVILLISVFVMFMNFVV